MPALMETAMPADRQRVQPWFACPRMFIKDSGPFTRFLMQSLYEVARDITETVKRVRPDAIVIYHSWPKPALLPYYDVACCEIYIGRPFYHRSRA
jgi:hypothetical protein